MLANRKLATNHHHVSLFARFLISQIGESEAAARRRRCPGQIHQVSETFKLRNQSRTLSSIFSYLSDGVSSVLNITSSSSLMFTHSLHSNAGSFKLKIEEDGDDDGDEQRGGNAHEEDYWLDELRREDMHLLESAFAEFDLDGSGCISHEELRDLLRSLGHNPTEHQVNQVMGQSDLDRSGALNKKEFLRFMAIHFSYCDIATDLRPVFDLIRGGEKGKVTVAQIKNTMLKVSSSLPLHKDEEDELFDGYSDEDELDFEDFVFLITGHVM